MVIMMMVRSLNCPRGLIFFYLRSFSFLYVNGIFLKSGPVQEGLPYETLKFISFGDGDCTYRMDGVFHIFSSTLGFTRDFLFQNHPT